MVISMSWRDILKLFPNPGEGWKKSSYQHVKDPRHKDGSDTFTEGNLQILATDHYKARFEQRGGKRQGQMLRDKLLQLSPNSNGWAFVSPDGTNFDSVIFQIFNNQRGKTIRLDTYYNFNKFGSEPALGLPKGKMLSVWDRDEERLQRARRELSRRKGQGGPSNPFTARPIAQGKRRSSNARRPGESKQQYRRRMSRR